MTPETNSPKAPQGEASDSLASQAPPARPFSWGQAIAARAQISTTFPNEEIDVERREK